MKITKSNINFQKILVAKGNVLKNNKPVPCRIYQLENGVDDNYFGGPREPKGKYSIVNLIDSSIREHNLNFKKTYVLEDEEGKCLNAALVDEYSHCDDEIHYIQSLGQEDGYKYAGETMLTFLLILTRYKNDKGVLASNVNKDAIEFYTKCKLEPLQRPFSRVCEDYYLSAKNILPLMKQNEAHTGNKVSVLI